MVVLGVGGEVGEWWSDDEGHGLRSL